MIASKPHSNMRQSKNLFPRHPNPKSNKIFKNDHPSFRLLQQNTDKFEGMSVINGATPKHYAKKSMRHSVNLLPAKFGNENRSPNRSVLGLRSSKGNMNFGGRIDSGKRQQWGAVRASGNYAKRRETSKNDCDKNEFRGIIKKIFNFKI